VAWLTKLPATPNLQATSLKHILSGILNILDNRERVKLARLILFDLVIGLLDIVFLGLLLLVINCYTKNAVLPKIAFLPESLFNQNSLMLIGIFFLLFSFKNWMAYAGLKVQHHFFYEVASRLSKRNILHYLNDNYTRFVGIDSSVQIRRISQQPIEFSHYILTNFQQVVSQVILIFFTACAILAFHPTLFLLLLLLLLPPVVSLAWFIRKKSKEVRTHTKIASERTIQHLQESLAGFVESNIYQKNIFFIDRYTGYQQQLNQNLASQQTLQSLPPRLVEVFAILGFFILIVINKWSGNTPAVDLLTIGVFTAAAYKIIPGMVKILNCTGQMKTYQFTLTDLAPDKNTAISEISSVECITSLRFDRVHFSYKDHTILDNMSFKLHPGDFMGVTGNSGRGKTTIVNLLLGFLTPASGAIYINDKKMDDGERQSYWPKISYVKQQPFFIHDSILKNITLTDGWYDKDRLNQALAFCGADQLVAGYPEGLEKIIKENGKNISGGQRQRLMLARAMYADFDLLILDEPFSELDEDAEHCILKKLQVLAAQGKMIMYITHNKIGLTFCNKTHSLDGK
jgi:ABC-type multidrug transport system fused ATPase/permease subunit